VLKLSVNPCHVSGSTSLARHHIQEARPIPAGNKGLKKCADAAEEGHKRASLTAVTPGEGSAECRQPWGLVSCRTPSPGGTLEHGQIQHSRRRAAAQLCAPGTMAGQSWDRQHFRQSPHFCVPATLSRSPDVAPFATLPVLCGCPQPPSARAAPHCGTCGNICGLHSCETPSPRSPPAHAPVSWPRHGSHSQEMQRPRLVLSSTTSLLQAEEKQSTCSVPHWKEQAFRRPGAWTQLFPRHGSKDTVWKLGHPCLELRAAVRLTRTLAEAKRQLLWAAHEGGLASAPDPWPPFLLIGPSAWWTLMSKSCPGFLHLPLPAQQESFPKMSSRTVGFSTGQQCWSLGRRVYVALQDQSDCFRVNSNAKLT